ncbi:MAG TPA: anthranilate phosphoribosyltransferase [Balneolales bacterium]|nr:anthranilate phosphoribosyltransferase [Balneolales bacterium]
MQSYTDILNKLADGQDLTSDEATSAIRSIINGEVSESEISAFLFGMRMKGETVDELTAIVKVMRDAAVQVNVDLEHAVDLCGTGGDRSGTFNISTGSMFVAAGAGVPVLKHGNRSVSSKSGSADVLEALGAVATLKKDEVEQVFNQTGMAFMFAPFFHPAMKEVMPTRHALKIRTFFNILGPLLNPAKVKRQIIGAYSKEVAYTIIQILSNLDTEYAYGVNSHDGLDEFSIGTYTEVFELKNNLYSDSVRFDPREFGFIKAGLDEIQGGDKDKNAGIIRSILKGEATDAQRDVILLNSMFAIQASGIATDLKEAKEAAVDSLQSGRALKKLNDFVTATNDVHNS